MNVIAVLVLVGAVAVITLTVHAGSRLLRLAPPARDRMSFLSGGSAVEHAVSRFHVRWYTLTMIFLAFDMELVFVYPWTLVVSAVGTPVVVERGPRYAGQSTFHPESPPLAVAFSSLTTTPPNSS